MRKKGRIPKAEEQLATKDFKEGNVAFNRSIWRKFTNMVKKDEQAAEELRAIFKDHQLDDNAFDVMQQSALASKTKNHV